MNATPPADRPLHPKNTGNGCIALLVQLLAQLAMIKGGRARPGR